MEVILSERIMDLSSDELVAYIRLSFNSSKDGYVYGSNKELSEMIGLSIPRTRIALDGLFERKMVSFGNGKVFVFGHEKNIKHDESGSSTKKEMPTDVVRLKDVPKVVKCSMAEDVCSYFNQRMNGKGMPLVKVLTTRRKVTIDARVKEYGIEKVKFMIDKAALSAFLNGSGGWFASFDWIMRPNNFIKVLEGNYDDRKTGNNQCAEQGYYNDTISLMRRLDSERKAKGNQ